MISGSKIKIPAALESVHTNRGAVIRREAGCGIETVIMKNGEMLLQRSVRLPPLPPPFFFPYFYFFFLTSFGLVAALFRFPVSADLEGIFVERGISSPPFYTQQVGSQDGKCFLVLDVRISVGWL